MEMAVCNVVDPGEDVLVVDTGYFSARMATMLERRGARVRLVAAEPGHTVAPERVEAALREAPVQAVFITHVDTSTGVRADVQGIARVAKAHGALVVVDGVCATAAERLDTAADGVDIYLTASQKAVGAPPGLALLVASPAALAARARRSSLPPLSMDFDAWRPVMEAYEAGKPSYFATPATSLILAADAGLQEIVADGMEAVWGRHQLVADRMRAAWRHLDLELLPARPDIAAHTLSALRYPEGIDASFLGGVAARGVAVAGGLHPQLKTTYFRVGHMGWVTTQPQLLARAVRAIGEALADAGHRGDVDAAVAAVAP
jgi:alanine-glyoxylate transaminase/serine-glyoxylate transaminase/serine-pyruvate transaminase